MKEKKEEAVLTPQDVGQNEQPTQQQESKGKRIANTIINVVLVVAIVLAALCTYVSYVSSSGNGTPSIFGISIFSIQTDSMYPNLVAGDLIIGRSVDPEDLRTNDVITFWTLIDGKKVLNTHRIVGIYDGGGFLIFETKGDYNTTVDALTVHDSNVVAKYTGIRVKGLGKAFDYLQTSTGFLLVVVIPVFLFFLYHLVQFFRTLFEYQNVKNRIKYEQERGRTEDMIAEQQAAQAAARAKMEAELREKLKAEILAGMAAEAAQTNNDEKTTDEPPAQTPEEPAAEEKPQT